MSLRNNMKTKEKQSLKEKALPELETLLVQKKLEIVKTQGDMFRGKIKNVHSLKTMRNDVSRIKTYIRQKQLIQVGVKP